MKEPLQVFEDLPNHYAQANVAFSPDEQLFFTGTSVEKNSSTGGLLCFYDRQRLEMVSRIGISPTCSVVQCAWHPRLNQVQHFHVFVLFLYFQLGECRSSVKSIIPSLQFLVSVNFRLPYLALCLCRSLPHQGINTKE